MNQGDAVEVGPKLYLNGFPKSGTHALVSLAAVMLPRLVMKGNWFGNLSDHSFSTRRGRSDEEVAEVLNDFLAGRYIKGHMAHSEAIAQAFQDNKIAKVFIFRDFRDVAVSAAYHATTEGNTFPEIDFYRSLEFDEVLRRIITGDENIDGVMKRWEMFAPWLGEDWVLKLTYEDFVEEQVGVAGLFLRYLYGKTASYMGKDVVLDPIDYHNEVNRLVKGMKHPDKMSVTYRKGKTGGWKTHFTDEHKELFKESDKNDWLIRLGYADDRDW